MKWFDLISKDIIKATINNDLELVKKLSQTMNIDFKNKDGKSALFYACMNGNIDICKFLIHKGAKIDTRDDRNLMPIHYALLTNKNEIINLLCEIGEFDLDIIKTEIENVELEDKRVFLNFIKKIF